MPRPKTYAPPARPGFENTLRKRSLAQHQAQNRRLRGLQIDFAPQTLAASHDRTAQNATPRCERSSQPSWPVEQNAPPFANRPPAVTKQRPVPDKNPLKNKPRKSGPVVNQTGFGTGTPSGAPVDLSAFRPSAPLLARQPASFWIRNCAIPWVQLGDTVAIAFADPTQITSLTAELTESFGPFIPVVAPRGQIVNLLLQHFKAPLARRASVSVPAGLSTRSLLQRPKNMGHFLPVSTVLTLAVLFPTEVFSGFCALALALLLMFTGLKLAGLSAHFRRNLDRTGPQTRSLPVQDLPAISVLVPLYQEAEISSALLKRLRRLDYPQDKLEVLLVLEEGDTVTRSAIDEAELPGWIAVIEVPIWGDLRTKPRAMNYALNFCRGDIIGVWDAEDAPLPDQLQRVASAFATAPPEVVCFQGILDYYNPRANWISRCFTLEYASWFRVVLQGIAKLDLVVPLGGTTMFVRRAVLDDLGGWDAHNVTEDADLGVRLFRAGYRTRMLPTTTFEEASCRPNTWIRQRSRWLKGFMATYLVHMRRPVQLWRDLGSAAFIGFQAFFLGTVGQFLLAPFLWTYWLVLIGLPHPSATVVPPQVVSLTIVALVFFELLGIVIAATAAFASGRPSLAIWAPCLSFYFMMGVIAVYKALYELLWHPFFWDKTSHGFHPPSARDEAHISEQIQQNQ